MPLKEIGTIAKNRGIKFLVDAAQGAGMMDLDVEKINASMLAMPGHKGLLGPLGTGALYVSPNVDLIPILQGGTGSASKSQIQPRDFPEGFEAGTINAPAIIGLGHSAEFVDKIGVDTISSYEEELISYLDEHLKNMDFVRLYGPEPHLKTGISLINVAGISAEDVTSKLNEEFGIAVRGGYHCAPLAHKTVGTWETGAVRISVGPYNTKKDINALINSLYEINKNNV
jgi:selenocysteine lyase/cysteine desulfurase